MFDTAGFLSELYHYTLNVHVVLSKRMPSLRAQSTLHLTSVYSLRLHRRCAEDMVALRNPLRPGFICPVCGASTLDAQEHLSVSLAIQMDDQSQCTQPRLRQLDYVTDGHLRLGSRRWKIYLPWICCLSCGDRRHHNENERQGHEKRLGTKRRWKQVWRRATFSSGQPQGGRWDTCWPADS